MLQTNPHSISNLPSVTHSVDAEGVAWIVFDHKSARANILNPDTLSALRRSVEELSALARETDSPVKAVVISSAKEKIFIAGADLNWLATLSDSTAATLAAAEGHALFALLANLKVPVVCAIHGACAGGGYELALACTWRISSDAPETRIGLPEVGLGLIPAWGGCVRLAKLIGAQAAVEFILNATLVPSASAHSIGLVDELAPLAELKSRAKAVALQLAKDGVTPRPAPSAPSRDFFWTTRANALTRWRGQPAPLAAIEVVEKAMDLSLEQAFAVEAACFGKIATGEVAKNLIQIFLLKGKVRKNTLAAWFPESQETLPTAAFRTIGIVGAGVMGAGIAHWCAAHGYGVILCDVSKAAIERGVMVIRELFADSVKQGAVTADEAHRMTGGIGITTSLEDFEFCDLVIEAIVEDLSAKQKLFGELSTIVKADCVLTSNSSAIPVAELAAGVPHPGRVIGLHFFNPVSQATLVELALSPHTTRATAERVFGWIKAVNRTAVVVGSSPGGFVTRILSFYLNEACRLWEQGVPLALIDEAMTEWGWRMGPLQLIDQIGIDVTDAVFREMSHYFSDRYASSSICSRMLTAELKGRKHDEGAGFYNYENTPPVANPSLAKLAPDSAIVSPMKNVKAVQDHLNGIMLDESRRAISEGVIKTPDEADLALILGVGFPAFRGGPLQSAK